MNRSFTGNLDAVFKLQISLNNTNITHNYLYYKNGC